MATEAQKLIGISLSKIAQSRSHRGGVSLHKNLLVATVLQKARFIFMEEAYQMVYRNKEQEHEQERSGGVGVPYDKDQIHMEQQANETDFVNVDDEDDDEKENVPSKWSQKRTYLDLDHLDRPNKIEKRRKHISEWEALQMTQKLDFLSTAEDIVPDDDDDDNHEKENLPPSSGVKRRRIISEWETEEAVLSILPKRCKSDSDSDNQSDSDCETDSDSVFFPENYPIQVDFAENPTKKCDDVNYNNKNNGPGPDSVPVSHNCVSNIAYLAKIDDENSFCPQNCSNSNDANVTNDTNVTDTSVEDSDAENSMEINHITSLVSIFSFDSLKLNRSVSTPDLCSALVKENTLKSTHFLTMTV